MQDEKTGESLTYDLIVLGTGMKECILGGLLSVEGKKVLTIDRNDFYGSDSASLNLKQCRQNEALKGAIGANLELSDEDYQKTVGRSKDFNIDLCPKFLMAGGDLVKILLKTKVTKYLDFKSVGGSYVFNTEKKRTFEIPMTAKKAWDSSMLGITEKKRLGDFLSYINKVDVPNKGTWKASGLGWSKNFDLETCIPKDMFEYFKLSTKMMEFIGHCVCLYPTDRYLTFKGKDGKTKMIEAIQRMKLYINSILIYPETSSPYLYPMWGLGGLSEGFARLGAVYGGCFMLRKDAAEILYGDSGECIGVKATDGEIAYCKQIICDPSYLEGTDKVKQSGWIARSIMIIDNILPGTTPGDTSAQVIFPITQTGHSCDVYCTMIGKDLECASKGRYVVVCSTKVASEEDMSPLTVVREFITNGGVNILEEFQTVRPTFVGINQTAGDNVYICSSPDHTTHFQNAARQVSNLYHAMTGRALDLATLPKTEDE